MFLGWLFGERDNPAPRVRRDRRPVPHGHCPACGCGYLENKTRTRLRSGRVRVTGTCFGCQARVSYVTEK
jgi:hypothetical protein